MLSGDWRLYLAVQSTAPETEWKTILAIIAIGVGIGAGVEALRRRVLRLEEKEKKHHENIVRLFARARRVRHNLNNLWQRTNELDNSRSRPVWNYRDEIGDAEDEADGDVEE